MILFRGVGYDQRDNLCGIRYWKGRAAAAGCTYLLLAPFDGADDQGYTDAQVLDTEAEGVAIDQFVIVETDGVAALVSGKLSLSGKTGVGYNLGLDQPSAIVRTLGTAFLLRWQQDSVSTKYTGFGWSDVNNNINPSVADYGVRAGGLPGTIEKHGDGMATSQIGSMTVDTEYQVSMVLGGYDSNEQPWYSGAAGTFIHGCAYFIKGGSYTDWTLLWREALQNTANLYPFVSIYGTDFAALFQYLRVPDHDYSAVLQPTAADWFTDTNGTSLDAHTPDVTPGGGWTEHDGSWEIQGNQATQTTAPVGGGQHSATVDVAESDVFVRVNVTTAAVGDSIPGVVVRAVDAENLWRIQINTSTSQFAIIERTGGVNTNRANTAATINTGTTYELTVKCAEDWIIAWLDGDDRIAYGSSTRNTATRHGLGEVRDSVNQPNDNGYDNFHVQPTSVYTELDDCPGYAVKRIVQDLFTDDNDVSLADHTPDLVYSGGWNLAGTWDIQSNTARCATTGIPRYAYMETGAADAFVSVNVTTPASGTFEDGLMVRHQDNNNYFKVVLNSVAGAFQITRILSGGSTVRATTAFVPAASTTYEITFSVVGNDLEAWVDGGNRIAVTDTSFNTATKHGLFGNNSAAASYYDNFQVYET